MNLHVRVIFKQIFPANLMYVRLGIVKGDVVILLIKPSDNWEYKMNR